MTNSVFATLSKNAQEELLQDLNCLHLAEIKSFCKRHSIPTGSQSRHPTEIEEPPREDDRKGPILARVRHFLKTGEILPETCFPSRVVCFDRLPKNLTPDDRLYYGQYDKTHRGMIALLKSLTGGRFENGAIRQNSCQELLGPGQSSHLQEFASAWLQALRDHTQPNPEWAFLSDRASKKDTVDWKLLRIAKASKVMKVLNQVRLK